MKLLRFLLSRSKRLVMSALVAGVISGAANTGGLALINEALNRRPGAHSLLPAAFVALCILLALSRVISEFLLARLGQGALFDLRMRLSRQILGIPLRQLEKVGAHRVLAALTEDIPVITNIVNMIPVLCINIAIVIAGLVYMGWLSWIMLAAVIGMAVIGVISYKLGLSKAIKYLRLAREENDTLYKHFRALADGVKELKLHRKRRERFLAQVLEKSASLVRDNNLNGLRIYILASSWGQSLMFLTIGLLLFALPWTAGIGAPAMTGFILTIIYIMGPLQAIMNTLPMLGRANVAINNIDKLGLSLSENVEVESPAAGASPPRSETLQLSQVTHAYYYEGEDRNFVLGPIDLVLKPGELMFLIGGNGSGKTTLAKLLTGLYAPETGEIWWGKERIDDAGRENYRQHFSVIFSDFFLFDSLLGLESPEIEPLARSYLTTLQLSHKVQLNDGVFSTIDLSQGQRKRLALLTAYLENRPVYVFDEWAADQDPIFKELFYLQILPDLKASGKTVIVISHDDRYYHLGDKLIKLENGRIVSSEEGAYNYGQGKSVC